MLSALISSGLNTHRQVYSTRPIYTTFYGLGFGIPPTLGSALSSQEGNDYRTLLPIEGMNLYGHPLISDRYEARSR